MLSIAVIVGCQGNTAEHTCQFLQLNFLNFICMLCYLVTFLKISCIWKTLNVLFHLKLKFYFVIKSFKLIKENWPDYHITWHCTIHKEQVKMFYSMICESPCIIKFLVESNDWCYVMLFEVWNVGFRCMQRIAYEKRKMGN